MKQILQSILIICLILFIESKNGLAQQTLFGTTINGGNGSGIIFGVPTGSTGLSQQLNIPVDYAGKNAMYNDLIQASNGKFYGMTYAGGTNNLGIIFEYDPATLTYTKTVDFNSIQVYNPKGGLVEAPNGKLYGMAAGGVNNYGLLFEYDIPTRTVTKKLDFNGTANGREPYGSLILANNGKLYGMTWYGGANSMGVLFEYDPSTNTYAKKLDFNGSANGSKPQGSLMKASNGKLYGMTYEGGTNNYGVLFEYDAATSIYTKKLDFNGSANGRYPIGNLMQAGNGKLYGLTSDGGTNFVGVLFEYNLTTNVYTKKMDFNSASSGSTPSGSLVEAPNGKLYGMTAIGGTNGLGVLFEYDYTTSTYTKKFDFNGTLKGSKPMGTLVKATNGKLYSLTYQGGTSDCGVLFEYDAASNGYTKRFDMSGHGKMAGNKPQGSLVEVNGKLYGTTYIGGTKDFGVLFEYDPIFNIYTKKIDFNGTLNGSTPCNALMKASNGKLYGVTFSGGVNDDGVLFEYDASTGIYTKKVDLEYSTKGSASYGDMIQASNGKIYGTAQSGGAGGGGVIFEYDITTNTYVKKYEFTQGGSGNNPIGTLVEALPGILYGNTAAGGANNDGILFTYDFLTNTFTKKMDYNSIVTGASPIASMILASNGKLYGTTNLSGFNSMGTLFEYDVTTSSYTKKLDFDGQLTGSSPWSGMKEASNGLLYGVTISGGLYDMGVLYEYDTSNDTYLKKVDFNDTINGSSPLCALTELNIIATGITSKNSFDNSLVNIFPNPSNGLFTIDANSGTKINVTDIIGQVIISETMLTGRQQLDISNYANGVYFIKAMQKDRQQTIKIIKK